MRLLVLGGTLFLGRHVVDAALARGHTVTAFTRGLTDPGAFPQIEHLHGDRTRDLSTLDDGTWDAVVDTSCYLPRVARLSAETLASHAAHYVFVSSISAYAEPLTPGYDETAPVAQLSDPTDQETFSFERYGALKALCESEVQRAFGADRTLVVRPGLIVGPHDPSNRFTYWVMRIARGGEVAAPGSPDAPTEFIDARDLAAWMVHCAESRVAGVMNASGPASPTTLGDVLRTCVRVSGADARLTWIDEATLLAHHVTPWTEMPLWIPAADLAVTDCNTERARSAGLVHRSVEDTVRDTLAFFTEAERDPVLAARIERGRKMPTGLSIERERELLDAWRATSS